MEEYKIGSLSKFAIIDKEQHVIGGFIGDDNVDTAGHIIPKEIYVEALKEYLPWGNIRDAHGKAVGTVTEYGTKGWNYIEVKIVDDNAWKMVEGGVYKGFSIGAKVYETSNVPFSTIAVEKLKSLPSMTYKALQRIGKILRIDSMLLAEISITDRPVNQAALFAKSIDDKEVPVLQSMLNEMVSTENTANLAPIGATVGKKRKKFHKKKEKMMDDTQKEIAVDVVETSPVIENAAPEASQDEVVVKNIENAVQADYANTAIPPKEGATDTMPEPQRDPMDGMKAYIDASFMNMFTSLVEQINISNNMLGEKVASIVSAMMTQIMQCMVDDTAEEQAEPESQPVPTETQPTTQQKEIVADLLTADMVKSIIKDALAEIAPTIATVRKGTINKGMGEVEPEAPKAPANVREQYRNVATLMAKASIVHK